MPQYNIFEGAERARNALLDSTTRSQSIPVTVASDPSQVADLSETDKAWLKSSGFGYTAGECVLLPDVNGDIARVVCGFDEQAEAAPSSSFFAADLAARLPKGNYHIETSVSDESLTALAWTLGTYAFTTHKSAEATPPRRLKASKSIDIDMTRSIANGVFLGRDLINTPANDLGPDELEATVQNTAKAYGAKVSVIKGDDLLKKNFPMIHAVGRASDRAPRLIDLKWGKKSHPKLTLVGKGIVFDTGGLNLKPGNSMTLMKKDMGGAATALAVAAMIMSTRLPVQLRALLPVAENSVSSNAYRPGDVLPSRNGMTVEIGNTDAEGRLVLADALTFAEEEKPDTLLCFATLTGAARVALGPDLPPLYTTTDELAQTILSAGRDVHDPLWRMPFWDPYSKTLQSQTADISHISNGPFAGSITAALFLKHFVTKTPEFAHIDLYGWVSTPRPGFPKGGEPNSARAIFEWARRRYGQ